MLNTSENQNSHAVNNSNEVLAMEDKSVIVFYRLATECWQDMTWEEADEYVGKHYGREAICRNVGHTPIEPEILAECVPFWLLNDVEFRALVKREREFGANFLFVSPVVGAPIWGLSLN